MTSAAIYDEESVVGRRDCTANSGVDDLGNNGLYASNLDVSSFSFNVLINPVIILIYERNV